MNHDPPIGCITEELMERIAKGEIPEKDAEKIAKEALSCPICRERWFNFWMNKATSPS